jgi:type I restriction enzyme M protein
MGKLSSQDLYNVLWASADEMRGVMRADDYKDYLLGLTFYKALSDKELYTVVDLLENRKPESLEEAQEIYENAKNDKDVWDDLEDELVEKYGCAIQPEYTFMAFYNGINNKTFMLSQLRQGFRDIEQSQGQIYADLFEGFDVDSKNLGRTPEKRNEMISSVMKKLAAIDFTDYDDDALGDAYEYLIAKFASEAGSKAGEFYTPAQVSRLIAQIGTAGKEKKLDFTVMDPCAGSGSLALRVRDYMYRDKDTHEDYSRHIQFFCTELVNQTYNLLRMNFMLHQVPADNLHLRNGDTLDMDWPTDEPTTFDAVVMNPPYSAHWKPNANTLIDPRFAPYEKLAPKSKADYAFLLHGYYHLKDTGTMGIVLPHGILFRGGAEGIIRKHLIDDGSIYAVVGLAPNLFYSTSIPVCLVFLKKNNRDRSILFVDASKEFKKEKARNLLTDENVKKIVDTVLARKDVDKFAHLASYEEIVKNDYNLNIPRYVDISEPEPEIDINDVISQYHKTEEEENALKEELASYFKDLGIKM